MLIGGDQIVSTGYTCVCVYWQRYTIIISKNETSFLFPPLPPRGNKKIKAKAYVCTMTEYSVQTKNMYNVSLQTTMF